ncbi:MAG: LysR family transcriptional regulator [Lachnospiraceae bacterium]|nr:LysR family transcriptional regulator [Lachnospiraceae bacterium]
MNLKYLNSFIVTAESGNITAAAKKLGIGQPQLSKQIMQLEAELDTTLIIRTPRNISLTSEGSLLYSRAKDILALTDVTLKELDQLKTGNSTIIKLGTISSCGHALLDEYLVSFCKKHPQVTFEVYEGNTFEQLDKLKNGIIETAIVRTPFHTDGLECFYGLKEPLVAVGFEHYFSSLLQPAITIPDLADKPLIYYRRFDSLIHSAFLQHGLVPNTFCKNDDARTTLEWAKKGLGIGLLPKSAALSIKDSFSPKTPITMRELAHEETTTQITAVYRKNSNISILAKEFAQGFGQRQTP